AAGAGRGPQRVQPRQPRPDRDRGPVSGCAPHQRGVQRIRYGILHRLPEPDGWRDRRDGPGSCSRTQWLGFEPTIKTGTCFAACSLLPQERHRAHLGNTMTMPKQIRTKHLLAACVLIGLCATAQAQSTSSTAPELAAQPLNEALRSFAKQTGLQLIYVSEPVLGQRSNPVPGGLAPGEALKRLLEGTGLTFEFINDRTVEIRPQPTPDNAGARYKHTTSGALRLAQSSASPSHASGQDTRHVRAQTAPEGDQYTSA